MSDFDKEAEREKLRKKYEQEQKEREATEQMSELLLQGATMTNAHCSDCGNPIFRYDGQEFCPACEKAVDRDTGTEGEEESTDTADETENIEVTSPDDGARVAFGGENVQDQQPSTEADQQAPAQSGDASSEAETDHQPQQPQHAQQPQQSQQTEQSTPAQHQSRSPTETRQPQERAQPEPSRNVPSVEPNSGGDVSAARDSLVRTLTHFSQQADATDDPQRAQEYLAAAREAAETLAALRQ